MTPARALAAAHPVEEFLQALTAQLDRAQDTLALKVRAGRPLTWALKDLSIDLRVFLEVDPAGRVLLRTAGPNEDAASTVHLSLTTITRPMVEENTRSFEEDTDPRSIEDLGQVAHLDEGDRKKLDWMGVRTVGQLKRLSAEADTGAVEAMVGLPVNRLRAALEAASRPHVVGQEVVQDARGPLLRIFGANLSVGGRSDVRLAGEPVEVLHARPQELLVRPGPHHEHGAVEVFVGDQCATGYFRMPPTSEPLAVTAGGRSFEP
jgi:hypothetical protein